MIDLILQIAGIIFILVGLLDVFLTVLYARSGTGLISPLVCKGVWQSFRGLGRSAGRWRDTVLSFSGPVLLVVIAVTWITLVIVGFALIFWPMLGHGIRASSGPTEETFAAAVYFSAFSFTTLGTGDLVPKSAAAQLLMTLEAGLGFSLFTLVITYFLSIYTALQRRNTFASELHHKTLATGDAAEYVARLGPGGQFGSAGQDLSNMARRMVDLLESHKFYPVLHFFRFREPRYSLPRVGLVVMDSVTLIRSALNEEDHKHLIRSNGVAELWSSGMNVLEHLARDFLPEKNPHEGYPVKPGNERLWGERYEAACRRFEAEGISARLSSDEGRERYLRLRREWDPYLSSFAQSLLLDMAEVIPDANFSSKPPEEIG